MNTKHTYKSEKESVSLDFRESNLIVNKNENPNETAHTITNHKEVYKEKNAGTQKDVRLNCGLLFSKDTDPRCLGKATINPIVETNLKTGDLELLSAEMGKEIASLVVDEIVSLQSPQKSAITRQSADNFIYKI